MHRDIGSPTLDAGGPFAEGRRIVAVIGIDRYRAWPMLSNAVRDALGALEVFRRLGFEPIVAPLINESATSDAIHRLVTDDLATLGSSDSLVVFFAGHGHTQTRTLQSGPVQTGFLIPIDGDRPDGRTATWLRLDTWLSDVARLPARHILVILDACHSGLALGSMIKWRGAGEALRDGSLEQLRHRQSRRVITSALGDQRAMDGGPIAGHSLFTGCLIEGLTGGLTRHGRPEVTGSEIGLYVQQRVSSYTDSQQTPDFGTLELDHRGEIVVPIMTGGAPLPLPSAAAPMTLPAVGNAYSDLPSRAGARVDHARAVRLHTALVAQSTKRAAPGTTAQARARLLAAWKRRPILVTLGLMSVWPFAILYYSWDKLSPRVRVIGVVTSIVVFIVIPLSSRPRHSGDERGQSTVNAGSGQRSGVASSSNPDDNRRSTAAHKPAPPEDRAAREPSSTSPSSKTASMVGARDEAVMKLAMPDSAAGTAKIIRDANALLIGGSYVLARETPLMPGPAPRDPVAALALVRKLPAGSTFAVVDKRTISGIVWYKIRTATNESIIGWLKSIALVGQDVRVAGGASNE